MTLALPPTTSTVARGGLPRAVRAAQISARACRTACSASRA
ncbi:hypothetical protein ACFQ1I_32230 [Kitasatospora arboriphila]